MAHRPLLALQKIVSNNQTEIAARTGAKVIRPTAAAPADVSPMVANCGVLAHETDKVGGMTRIRDDSQEKTTSLLQTLQMSVAGIPVSQLLRLRIQTAITRRTNLRKNKFPGFVWPLKR